MLLDRFEPDAAREIAREAAAIDRVDPEEARAAIDEFLTVVGRDALGGETSSLLAREARRNVDARSRGAARSSLESLSPRALADALRGERASTRAVALALLSSPRRDALLELFSEEDRASTLRLLAAFKRFDATSAVVKRVEDVLFERALEE